MLRTLRALQTTLLCLHCASYVAETALKLTTLEKETSKRSFKIMTVRENVDKLILRSQQQYIQSERTSV